jgi:CRP-like cAMP-binding protein
VLLKTDLSYPVSIFLPKKTMSGENKMTPEQSVQIKNLILRSLPRQEYRELFASAAPVEIPLGRVLYHNGEEARHAYFPNSGVISMLHSIESGDMIEVGLIGCEGMAGLPIILGGTEVTNNALVQIKGQAIRINADVLRNEFNKGGKLQKLLLRYLHLRFECLARTVACNRLHTVDQRLAKWLAMMQGRSGADSFEITQETMSRMLGVRRSGVTVSAGDLQRAKLIRYSRGKIDIINTQGLESAACDCLADFRMRTSSFVNEINQLN